MMTNEDELKVAEKQLSHLRDEITRIEEDGEEAEFESNRARRRLRRADLSRLYQREYERLSRIRRLTGQSISYAVAGDL